MTGTWKAVKHVMHVLLHFSDSNAFVKLCVENLFCIVSLGYRELRMSLNQQLYLPKLPINKKKARMLSLKTGTGWELAGCEVRAEPLGERGRA